MPGKDGTGPFGEGPLSGRGGLGGGHGQGKGNRAGAGPGGYCVCPSCGEKKPHTAGTPCSSLTCIACGKQMIRESEEK